VPKAAQRTDKIRRGEGGKNDAREAEELTELPLHAEIEWGGRGETKPFEKQPEFQIGGGGQVHALKPRASKAREKEKSQRGKKGRKGVEG